MTKRLIISFALLAALSCSRQDVNTPDSQREITLSMETKADFATKGTEIPSRILLAISQDYAKIDTDGLQQPFYNCYIPNIYQFAGEYYNTREKYPDNDNRVYIFGYAPENALSSSDNYKTLTPNYESFYNNPLWENILLCGPVSGNKSNHVNTPLVYSHPVSRFRFLAFKEESMVNYHVKHVVLKAGHEIVPYRLAWDKTSGMWKPQTMENTGINFTFKDQNAVEILGLGRENALEMGPYYLMPREGNNIGPFSIEATYYIEGDQSSEKVYSKENIYLTISSDRSGNPVSRINAGEDYVMLIRFNQDSFTLSGVRMDDWEDGGNIIIPIINETTDW